MELIQEANELINKIDLVDLEAKIASKLVENQTALQTHGFQSQEYISSLKEYTNLNSLQSQVSALSKKLHNLDSAYSLRNNSDFTELVESEISEVEPEISKLITSIKVSLSKPLQDDEKKAIFEIRPGVGGVEASLFAEDLFNMYTKFCTNNSLAFEVFNISYNEEGGINEAVFLVNQNESFGKFRFESGVHRVQRVPTTEASGRIHTSTASVALLPNIEKIDFNIKQDDLRIDVYRSSGPGGQSVNTTDSAVRVTHIPTGITVSCQNSKSQHKNKEIAMSILMSKLKDIENSKTSEAEKSIRNSAIQGGDRSAKIRTYNFPQSRITDHRINKSWFNIHEIINGELEEVINEVSLALRQS